MTPRWSDHEWYCFAHQSGHCSCRPAAVVKSAEGAAAGTHVPGASKAMQQMALDAHARAVAPADCRDPQPIPVTFASERHQVMCGRCEYRSPIVADGRSARQGFDAEHGTPILDAVFPPELCDLAHADRAMLHGRNMVPDERWNGLSS